MIRVVADTHALVWALANDPRLSPAARAAFAPPGNDTVGVSSISVAELLIWGRSRACLLERWPASSLYSELPRGRSRRFPSAS
jgi:PIN domain nuclease of toxin-antitoxin system